MSKLASHALFIAHRLSWAAAGAGRPTLPPGFQDELVTPVDRPWIRVRARRRILIARFPGVVRLFKNGSLDPVARPAHDDLRADLLGR